MRPNQAWAADITYLRHRSGFSYLFLLTDLYSRKIVGYSVKQSLAAEGALEALQMARRQRGLSPGIIHHSDRGIQYCCWAYTEKLQSRQISISMTEINHCYENAQAERLNGILKQEYGLGACFQTKAQVRQAVEQAVWLYNELRPHLSLNYQTPSEMHEKAA